MLFSIPHFAFAVLPPDVVFSVGAQLWQVLAGIGVFLTGAVVSVAPFIRSAVESVASRKRFFAFGILLVFLGIGYTVAVIGSGRTEIPPLSALSAPEHRFFSDRFVLTGKRADGAPILVDISLNRKEEDKKFIHYYYTDIIDGENAGKFSDTEVAPGEDILPKLGLSRFVRTLPGDRSTRESFVFAFSRFGKTYEIEARDLSADFLTKNEPEYTQYGSAGSGMLTEGGETIPIALYHERVYSSDYRPSIFFDGHETLRSTTTQLVLWDEAGNFYLIDDSDVATGSPAYATHFWALGKDASGRMRKAFTGSAGREYDGEKTRFVAEVPGLSGAKLSLELLRGYAPGDSEGFVRGEISDAAGRRGVEGEGYFHIYGTEE